MLFWEKNLIDSFYSVSIDEKKARYKGIPLMDIVVHVGVVSEDGLKTRRLSILLDVVCLDRKVQLALATRLEQVLQAYRLQKDKFLLLVADGADEGFVIIVLIFFFDAHLSWKRSCGRNFPSRSRERAVLLRSSPSPVVLCGECSERFAVEANSV
jgi:hypothetical protein